MEIQAKIKELRTERGWSQEQMAERLMVSRQAVTKWETGAGVPDVENLAAIAQLFGVTTDELVFGTRAQDAGESEPTNSSTTAIDLVEERHLDVRVGCARSVTLRGTDSEKASVTLIAPGITDLERAFKVILDTEGRNLDMEVSNRGVEADSVARQQLDVVVALPLAYLKDAELEVHADELHVEGTRFDMEVSGKVERVWLTDVQGHVELDVSIDMEAWLDDVLGKVDVNQMGAVSTIHVAHGAAFSAATRGRLGKRVLRLTRDGVPADDVAIEDAPLAIELAGARCELTVDSLSE